MATSGIKRADLKPCVACGQGVAHGNQLLSTRLRVTRFGMDIDAVRRQHGLELMLGSPVIAAVMGPDEDLLKPLEDESTVMVCDQCAMTTTVAELWELSEKKSPAKA